MQKIDRLGWAAGLAFACQGVRIGIRANTPLALEQASVRLPPGWALTPEPVVEELCSLRLEEVKPGSSLRRFSLLYWGSSLMTRSLAREEVLDTLEHYLHLLVALRARRRQFVRAAVAGWKNHAILILGPRASGKSTLLAALLREGATYYSDRYAVLDARGRVHPYPTLLPPHLRQGIEIATEDGDGREPEGKHAPKPLPVGLVIDTRYQAGAKYRPRLLSPGEALCSLLRQAVNTRWRPRAALASLHQVVTQARIVRGKRGEASEAALTLLKQVGNDVPTA